MLVYTHRFPPKPLARTLQKTKKKEEEEERRRAHGSLAGLLQADERNGNGSRSETALYYEAVSLSLESEYEREEERRGREESTREALENRLGPTGKVYP